MGATRSAPDFELFVSAAVSVGLAEAAGWQLADEFDKASIQDAA